MTSVCLKSAEPLVVYKLLWRGMSRGVRHFLDFRAMGNERIWAEPSPEGDAPVCPYTPLCGVFFPGWRNCPKRVENRRKNKFWNITKCDTIQRLWSAKNDSRWKPAIKWAGISSNRPQCGDFLLTSEMHTRRHFVSQRKKKQEFPLKTWDFTQTSVLASGAFLDDKKHDGMWIFCWGKLYFFAGCGIMLV